MLQKRVIFVVVVFTLLFGGEVHAAVSFVQPRPLPLTFTSDGSVAGLAKADVNGDGRPDIAVTYSAGGAGYIGLLLGDGNGQFKAPIVIALPTGAYNTFGGGIIAKDFDMDGVADLAVAASDGHGNNSVLFFKGRGDGTFNSPVPSALSTAGNGAPGQLQSSDLNGDAIPDIVTLDNGENKIAVLIGNGDGTFRAPVYYATGANPQDMAITDLNNDGKPDIVAGSYNDQNLTVFINDGTGVFASAQYPARIQLTGLYIGDFNKDGNNDLVMTGFGGPNCGTNCLVFVPGKGDGTFDPIPDGNFSPMIDWLSSSNSQKEIMDINGDGNPDIVVPVANGSNEVLVGLGRGDGTFSPYVYAAASATTGNNSANVDGGTPASVIAGDFDADGNPDIVVGESLNNTRNGGLSYLPGDTQGRFRSPRLFQLGHGLSSTTKSIVGGDFDNDGKADAVVITDALDFIKGNGDGTFAPSTVALGHISGPGEFYNTLRTADFDRDNNLDVVWLATGGVQGGYAPRNIAAFGNGDGTFPAYTVFSNSGSWAGVNLVIADFNNDSYPDIAVWASNPGSNNGRIEVFLYNTASPRTFVSPAGFSPMSLDPLSYYPGHALGTGDFDGDGNVDIIAHSTAGGSPDRLLFFRGNGDGTFAAPTSASFGLPEMNDFKSADLNKDGKLDLVGFGGGGAYVFLGNGDGTFAPPVYYDAGPYPAEIRLVDMDGDGNIDIVAATGRSTVVLPGKGDGTFGPAVRLAIGNASNFALDTADLDGDGKPDIVAGQNSGSRYSVTSLLNDSGARSDIRITAAQSPSSTDVGQPVTFTVTVTNDGPDTATGIVVNLTVPLNGMITSITAGQGSCTGTNTASCSVGDLANGANTTITVVAVPALAGMPLWIAADGYSTSSEANFINNGSSVSTAINSEYLKLYFPQVVMVGDTVDFVVRYANISGVALQDVVVVLDLPLLEYVSSNNGIYNANKGQVFWKLGSVPASTSGDLTAKVKIPWGIPGHTPFGAHAWMGWTGPIPTSHDITGYLSFTPNDLVSQRALAPVEITALLQDSSVKALYDYAVQQGYMDFGVGTAHTFSGASDEKRVLLLNPADGKVAAVVSSADGNFLQYMEKGKYGFGNTMGEVLMNYDSSSYEVGGDWAKIHSPSMGQCMWQCSMQNGTGWMLGDIPALGTITNTITNGVGCASCLSNPKQNTADCNSCLSLLTDKLPGLGTATGIAKCYNDCLSCVAQDPGANCYHCTQDFKWCQKGGLQTGQVPVSTHTHTCDTSTGLYMLGEEIVACPLDTCLPSEMVCRVNAQGVSECSCCRPELGEVCSGGEIKTSHDPNMLTGPGGDVVRGQTLTYTIEYQNVGAGTAYGVYVTAELDQHLDDSTLLIQNGGTYYAGIRTLHWLIGDLPPGQGGTVSYSVNVKSDAAIGAQIVGLAKVYFPSVPEITPTNPVVSFVRPVTALPQTIDAYSGTAVAVTLAGSDPTGNPLTYTLRTGPSMGGLTGTPPNLSYTSAAAFSGIDSFTYTVTDGITESDPATVSIRVNPSPADTTPPQVTAVTPRDGTSIAVSMVEYPPSSFYPLIRAYFNKPLDPATVTAGNFVVTAGGVPVSGTVSFDGSDNSIIFAPSGPLSYSTVYLVTLNTGIKDLVGNGLAMQYSWSFTTFGAAAINASPLMTDFGTIGTHTEKVLTVSIFNTGADYLHITSVSLGGADSAMFSIVSDLCSSSIIIPGGSCTVDVSFLPTVTGPKSATLSVESSSSPLLTSLSGSALLSQWTIGVNRSGSGSGIVTSNPAGINCGAVCSATYDDGITVELSALPDPASDFGGWSGNCAGNASPCSVLMEGPRTVNAPFNLIANFTADPLSGGAPLVVNFTDLSSAGSSSWLWIFGDGGSGATKNPTHVYLDPGSYPVSLVAWGGGDVYSITRDNYVTVTACQDRYARSGNGVFTPYDLIQDAYDNAGPGDYLDTLGIGIVESPRFDLGKDIIFRGGWDCGFNTNAWLRTVVHGVLTISGGPVTIEGLSIQ
ncbi:MAG: FG-GAP-like repeat-containing protein [Nitrospiraceae bacterium]|nr:FG-GAP-like repeat-containing protein [Nitrospiraceae bacterium]